MTTLSSPSQLLRSAAYFPVADVEQSAVYYERVFGFQRDYMAGSPPQFAIVSRDGQSLMLRLVPDPERIRPNEQQGGTWDVFFWVRGVRALHDELQTRGTGRCSVSDSRCDRIRLWRKTEDRHA